MSGIKVSVKTKAKETLKLFNQLRSYLFEQEYGELSNCTPARNRILWRLKGMVGFPFEEGVLTPLENDRLNTAFGIIKRT